MPFSNQDLQTDIYFEAKGTLSSRIDFAWTVYDSVSASQNEKTQALLFLIYAFDLRPSEDINTQLQNLMTEKKLYQNINPEYIPGKAPKHLPFDPGKTIPKRTLMYGLTYNRELRDAIRSNELLDVNDYSKKIDRLHNVFNKTALTRGVFRVLIRDGLFVQNSKKFDTSQMISHLKPGYAAFTLNSNGELSVFDHYGLKDGIAHSSMNAGAPVVAAGELRIENGKLKAITTHSGHYRPTLFNVYRVLEHFSANHVDISEAKVMTFKKPILSLNTLSTKQMYYPRIKLTVFETPATEIYKGINDSLLNGIHQLHPRLKSYSTTGFKSTFFKVKDKIIGSDLTQRRGLLASRLEQELSAFKSSLPKGSIHPCFFQAKLMELEAMVSKYEKENESLSILYGKKPANSRLNTTLSKFKEHIKEQKKLEVKEDIDPNRIRNMKQTQ